MYFIVFLLEIFFAINVWADLPDVYHVEVSLGDASPASDKGRGSLGKYTGDATNAGLRICVSGAHDAM